VYLRKTRLHLAQLVANILVDFERFVQAFALSFEFAARLSVLSTPKLVVFLPLSRVFE
jgi:hypothetical protein